MEHHGLDTTEVVLVAAASGVAACVVTTWLGASAALAVTSKPTGVTIAAAGTATTHLPHHLASPASAWPEPYRSALPSAPVYWTCTVLAAFAVVATIGGLVWLVSRGRVGTARRRPLGVDARSRFARRRDLDPLLITETDSRAVRDRDVRPATGRDRATTDPF